MKSRTRSILKLCLAIFMVAGGVAHFAKPDAYVALMPSFLPAPLFLVFLSGGIEAGFGLLLLVPSLSRIAAWGIIATLIAIYPANIYHAVSGGLDDPALPELMKSATMAWLRLPIQFLFILWAWSYTRNSAPRSPAVDAADS